MKKIYFVRHGESEGNIGSIRQSASSSLTEKGRSQAELLAQRFSNLPLDIIISSSMNRAKETAEVIKNKLNSDLLESDLFVERRRPSEVIGQPKDWPRALEIEKEILANFANPGWRLSDEENFEDLKQRAQEALQYLSERKEDNILVVTHGFFLRILIAFATMGEELNAQECVKFVRTFQTTNAGIAIFQFNEARLEHPWTILVWNEHVQIS